MACKTASESETETLAVSSTASRHKSTVLEVPTHQGEPCGTIIRFQVECDCGWLSHKYVTSESALSAFKHLHIGPITYPELTPK